MATIYFHFSLSKMTEVCSLELIVQRSVLLGDMEQTPFPIVCIKYRDILGCKYPMLIYPKIICVYP